MKLIKFILSLLLACSFVQSTNCGLFYKTFKCSTAAAAGAVAYNNVPVFVENLILKHATNIKNYADNIKFIDLKDYTSTDIANKLNMVSKIVAAFLAYEAAKSLIDSLCDNKKAPK